MRWNPPPPRPGALAPEVEEWSEEHCKVLYLVSLYAGAARTPEQREGWVRETPLLVLIFEGITAGALDFDYAPASVLLSHDGLSKRRWLNVSQEGKAAVDDMREAGLVNGLKLSTEDFQPVTALQVSKKGLALLLAIPPALKATVDSFTFPPVASGLPRERLSVELRDSTFVLFTPGGFFKESAVTETEDVSYVSSPYLPPAARAIERPGAPPMRAMSCNKHRAAESALGGDTIADELSEAIVLSNVHCLVGEWVPFGSNQVRRPPRSLQTPLLALPPARRQRCCCLPPVHLRAHLKSVFLACAWQHDARLRSCRLMTDSAPSTAAKVGSSPRSSTKTPPPLSSTCRRG